MRWTIILTLTLSFASVLGQGRRVEVRLRVTDDYAGLESFAREAAKAMEDVFNSEAFRKGVLARKYLMTNDLSNEQLYNAVMTAREKHDPQGTDGVVDLRVRVLQLDGKDSEYRDKCEIKSSGTRTTGVDGADSGIIGTCPQSLVLWSSRRDVARLAGHYAHEYMHNLGFSHRFPLGTLGEKKKKKKTFVYQIGYLVQSIAKGTESL
jgi:hypothetical protein